jgi:hypothetical protein
MPQPPRGGRRPRRVLTSMAPARWPVPHRVVASEGDSRDIVSTVLTETRRSTSKSPLRTPSTYTSGSGSGSEMVALLLFQSQLGRRDWTAWYAFAYEACSRSARVIIPMLDDRGDPGSGPPPQLDAPNRVQMIARNQGAQRVIRISL